MIDYLSLMINDYTLRTISMGTFIMGLVSGSLGCFTLLRKQSLLGDAISHAALPGIVIAFMLTGTKDPVVLFAGALLSGILGTLWLIGITENTRLKTDAALGIILSVLFGFGLLLLTMVQKQGNANQAGLDSFLFGQAATLLQRDVILMAVAGFFSLLLVAVLWKECKLLCFDKDYALSLGFNTKALNIVLTCLIVVAIVLGLQTVGVVLMSAMLIAPAAAARQWTNRLSVMVVLSGLFGALSGLIGTAISALYDNLATGPVIVLIASTVVLISFVFAPQRGLLARKIQHHRNRKDLSQRKTLAFMYGVVSDHSNFDHPHSIQILNDFQGYTNDALKQLVEQQLVTINQNMWCLTSQGYEQGKHWYIEKNP